MRASRDINSFNYSNIGLIQIYSTINFNIYSNYFDKKNDEHKNIKEFEYIPMLYIEGNGCLSNNIFIKNYAISFVRSNITSCYRSNLIEYVFTNINSTKHCFNTNYGPMNYELINKNMIFFIDNNISMINVKWINITNYSNVALDNIEFNILHTSKDKNINKNALIMISIHDNSNIMLIDTNINYMINNSVDKNMYYSIDFSYSEKCNLYCNNLINSSYFNFYHIIITQMLIHCDNINNNESYNTINYKLAIGSNNTQYVNHGSPVFIKLITFSNYFAGEILHINYSIYDKYNNIIPFNNFLKKGNLNIKLFNNDISFITNLIFNAPNGECLQCINGLYLGSITIYNINKTYIINTIVTNNLLKLKLP